MCCRITLRDSEGRLVVVPRYFPSDGGSELNEGRPREASMYVMASYSGYFDFRGRLDGRAASETLAGLKEAARRLGTRAFPDFWSPCKENVGYACEVLSRWAATHPGGVWRVS
ncbi:MAG: hypothetical protein ACTSU5_20690 [Promethearchaeota archaeon]